jgi:hypothetical protein
LRGRFGGRAGAPARLRAPLVFCCKPALVRVAGHLAAAAMNTYAASSVGRWHDYHRNVHVMRAAQA